MCVLFFSLCKETHSLCKLCVISENRFSSIKPAFHTLSEMANTLILSLDRVKISNQAVNTTSLLNLMMADQIVLKADQEFGRLTLSYSNYCDWSLVHVTVSASIWNVFIREVWHFIRHGFDFLLISAFILLPIQNKEVKKGPVKLYILHWYLQNKEIKL